MRIIAGEFRGRKLLPPEGRATRPIPDRVKQSLFDVLTPLLPSARIYDCFAGTGSMGLEALSRGAASALFFESDRSALARLRRNIDALGLAGRAQVIPGDLFRWFATSRPPQPAEIIFLDPPYRFLQERQDELQGLARQIASDHLAPGGTVVFRHDASDVLRFASLEPRDSRTYGRMVLEFLGHALPPRSGDDAVDPASGGTSA